MLGSDRLEPKYLCLPQIPDQTSGEASIVIKAIKQVFQLLPDLENHLPLETNPLTSINLQKLLDFLKGDNPQSPICVVGTFSKDEAIAYSYQELGLNLFDLPWFSPPEHKVFRHVNLLELFNHADVFSACFLTTQPAILKKDNFTHAAEHLQWARCHQFSRKIQQAVGHGERDRMQDSSTTWESMRSSIRAVNSKSLPCGDHCQLYCDIQEIIDKSSELDEQERLERSQQIAALDCQKYRLAQELYTPDVLESPKFKKIIILDDNSRFKELLAEDFKKLANTEFIDSKVEVETTLDINICWENFGLFKTKENGEKAERYDLVKKLVAEDKLSPAEILTCFDLDLGNPPESMQHPYPFVKNCFGGHWVLYGSAREHPDVARLVITGFRSQELLSYTAGGCAYLLKPVTTKNLANKIKEASILHRVTWLCPKEVQDDYGNLLQSISYKTLSFNSIRRHLENSLKWQRIELTTIEDINLKNKQNLCESEVIIIDLLDLNNTQSDLEHLIETITKLRQINHRISMIVVLPIVERAADPFAIYYRKLPLNLRDGSDMIIRKPMWLAGHPQPELALSTAITHQIKRLNDYDTKYQVMIPIAKLLENSSGTYLNLIDCMKAHGDASHKISEQLIKPLTQVFGGATSYELGIRGSWYDPTAQKIDDTVIMVEFCAKSSLMAKEFIEKTVVRYLKQIAGEDVVLLQEIPIRGRLL